MRISDWSSDVCSSDLIDYSVVEIQCRDHLRILFDKVADEWRNNALAEGNGARHIQRAARRPLTVAQRESLNPVRSEEHTSELQSLMRISYAVFCLKKKTTTNHTHHRTFLLTSLLNNYTTKAPRIKI